MSNLEKFKDYFNQELKVLFEKKILEKKVLPTFELLLGSTLKI